METGGYDPPSCDISNQTSTCVVNYLYFANQTRTNTVRPRYPKLASHFILLRQRISCYPAIVLASLTGIRSKQPNLA